MEGIDPNLITDIIPSEPDELNPIPIISLALPILKELRDVIIKLAANNIIVNRSATIDWNDSTIEEEWHIKNDVLKRKNNIIEKLLNNFEEKEISNIIEATGGTIPQNNKNLFDLGIISLNDKKLKINFKRISEFDLTTIIIIKFKTYFDNKKLYNHLCETDVNRVIKQQNGVYKLSFSVILDRADLWSNDFKSFTIKNIFLPIFTISIKKEIIEKSISTDIKKKLIDNISIIDKKNKNALRYIENFNNYISELNTKKRVVFISLCNVETTSGKANIRDIKFKISPFEIGNGYQLYLPTEITVQIVCLINGKDQALSGNFYFDEEQYKKFIFELFNEIDANILLE